MPNTPNITKQNTPQASGSKATPAQLKYLRTLAELTGTSFAYPASKAQASREIARMKALVDNSELGRDNAWRDSRREQSAVSRDLAERRHDAVAIRDDEIAGYGSSATWSH